MSTPFRSGPSIKRRSAPQHDSSGQATAEFVVLALALIPLLVLIPYIARYQDISHTTLLASRYAAFDAINYDFDDVSRWKTEEKLADEVRRRYFSNPGAAVKTGDTAGEFKAHRNPFWHDPNGDPLIRNFADITISRSKWRNEENYSTTDRNSSSSDHDGDPFILMDIHGNRSFNLKARGIYRASTSVQLANLPEGLKFYEPFDSIDLSMTRTTALLIDPWTAKSPDDVIKRIEASPEVYPAAGSVYGAPITTIKTVLAPWVTVVDLGLVDAPSIGKLQDWKDVVPKDRSH